MCKYCISSKKCEETTKIDCSSCNRFFLSEECFNNHTSNKVCKNYKYCKTCKKLTQDKNHVCGKIKCTNCRNIVSQHSHDCYVTPNDKFELEVEDYKLKVFVFYDFECFIDTTNGNKIHQPNLCCVNVVCDYCWNNDSQKKIYKYCQQCKGEENEFVGIDCVDQFLKYLFTDLDYKLKQLKQSTQLKDNIKVKVIAHNSKSYDSQFIINYFLKNNVKPTIIKKGSKILSLQYKNFNFIDSLSFLPMPLKNLPKTFGIENCEKGDFPHLFNTPENWYKQLDTLPHINYYQINLKKPIERLEFIKWYNNNKKNTFYFQTELIKYCKNDVDILMKSVMIFRNMWKQCFGLDCFTRCIT